MANYGLTSCALSFELLQKVKAGNSWRTQHKHHGGLMGIIRSDQALAVEKRAAAAVRSWRSLFYLRARSRCRPSSSPADSNAPRIPLCQTVIATRARGMKERKEFLRRKSSGELPGQIRIRNSLGPAAFESSAAAVSAVDGKAAVETAGEPKVAAEKVRAILWRGEGRMHVRGVEVSGVNSVCVFLSW